MSDGPWTDLNAVTPGQNEVAADICIVGAGAAGIYLATQMARRGRSVVLVEAGPKTGVNATTVGFDAVFGGDPYPGATAGRFFGLGGSTTRWGGVLVPHSPADLRTADPSAAVWSHIVGVVRDEAAGVLRTLGYRDGPDFEEFARNSLGASAQDLAGFGLSVQSGLYLPFRRKNLVGLLRQKSGQSRTRVFFNAVAKDWEIQTGVDGAAHLARLRVVSRNGNSLWISAGRFVICAGAIESARILLEMQAAYSQPVLRAAARPGCYLADHLSLPIADVVVEDLERIVGLFAPRFQGAWLRSFRFVEAAPPPGAPRCFAHFIFDNASRGFELAKSLLGALQQRCLPRVNRADLTAGLSNLVMLAYGRLVTSRLYIPPETPAHLQLDMEQFPVRENRVMLDDRTDDYGRRMARIDWRITEQDMVAMASTAKRFLGLWPGAPAGLPGLEPRSIVGVDGHAGDKPYDAYHPVGTCRMGDDEEAVVDTDLQVWGVDNLWLVSTGVLPSAGTANPTFTLLCLAQRLAERLQGAVR